MGAYTSIAAGDITAEATWHAGGPTAGYVTPGQAQALASTSSGTGGGVRCTLVTTPSATTVWVDGNITYNEGVTGGTEANGTFAVVNVSGATFELVPRKETTWAAGGTQTVTRTSDSAVGTVIGATAVSGGIQLTISGVATTWAIGDEVTGAGILGVTNANGIYVVRAATNTTNSTIDLAVKFVAAGSGGTATRGDTLTINHPVTLASTVAIGASPNSATGTALDVNHNGTTNTGKLTVQSGGNLILRGRANMSGSGSGVAILQVDGGGTLTFDSHFCAVATVRYAARLVGTSDRFDFAGTSGSRATVTSDNSAMALVSGTPAALGGQFTSGFSGNPRFVATYTDFTRIGGASTAYAVQGPCYPDISYCTFDYCGTINLGALPATSVVNLQHSTWTNLQASPILVTATNTAKTTGTWAIQYCVFGGFGPGIAVNADFVINNNIISGYAGNAGVSQTTGLGLISDSWLILRYATGGGGYYQRHVDCGLLGVHQANNARAFATTTTVTNGDPDASTPTFDGLIFDYPNTTSADYSGVETVPPGANGDTGDLIQTPQTNPTSPITHTIANSIALPISSGHPSDSYATRRFYPGTMFTGRGFGNVKMQGKGNTWYMGDGSAVRGNHGAINIAEGATALAGTVPIFRDNLCWSYATAGLPLLLANPSGVNPYTPSGTDHNASFNLITHTQTGTSNGTHYFGDTDATVGTGDITAVDPGFVDPDRCFVKWVRTLVGDLGTGTWTAGKRTDETNTDEQIIATGLAEILKLNDATFDSRYTFAAYQTYIRAGFAPTNATYRNSDSTGTKSIGAVDGVFGGHFMMLTGCGS